MKLNKLSLMLILILTLFITLMTESNLGSNLGSNIESMKNKDSTRISMGIRKKDIPYGDEDLYILKSQAVMPDCPMLPIIDESDSKKCQPCAPCGRCPEPSFECKKVPNYKRFGKDNNFVPLVSDFSKF
jgi:hypothetical protein